MVLADRSHPAIDNRRRQSLMRIIARICIGLVLALALGTSAGPALAVPFDLNSNGSNVPAGSPSMRSPATTTSAQVRAVPAVVRVTTPDHGFDWGDAGIGAAGGLAISLIGIGAALAISHSRSRRTTA